MMGYVVPRLSKDKLKWLLPDGRLNPKAVEDFKRVWEGQYVGKNYDPIKPLGWWDNLVLWWRRSK